MNFVEKITSYTFIIKNIQLQYKLLVKLNF